MKIIDRIFRRKEENPVEVIKLTLNELSELILLESDKENKEMEPFIKEKYEKISDITNDIPDLISNLLIDSEDVNPDKRVQKVGSANKDNIIHNLQSIHDKILVPDDLSFQKALEFCDVVKLTLKTVSLNTHKSQLYIKAIYPDQFEQIIYILSTLEDKIDELMYILIEKKDRFDSFMRFSNEVKNCISLRSVIADFELNKFKLDENIHELQFNIQQTEIEIQKLEQSDNFLKANELEVEIHRLSEELHNINQKIHRMFSFFSKIFVRMDKQDKSEKYILSSNNRKILHTVIDDPVFASDYDLVSFFTEVKKRIEDGSLGLKDQFAEKALHQIDKLNNYEELINLYDQRHKIMQQLTECYDILNNINVYKEKENLMRVISENKILLNELQAQNESKKNKLVTLHEELELLISGIDIETKILFDKKIELE